MTTLSLRQIGAYLELAEQLDRRERANDLAITFLGAQGDSKAIEKTIKEWGG
jgi:hypothetical protein